MSLLLEFKNKTKDNTNYPEGVGGGGLSKLTRHGHGQTLHIKTSTINGNRTENTGRANEENRESATCDVHQRARD